MYKAKILHMQDSSIQEQNQIISFIEKYTSVTTSLVRVIWTSIKDFPMIENIVLDA